MKDVEEKKISITDEEKKNVEEALKIAKETKDKDDIEAIKKTSEELSKAAQVVGQKMYQAESASAKTSEDKQAENEKKEENKNDKSKKDDDPIEGEVIDEK